MSEKAWPEQYSNPQSLNMHFIALTTETLQIATQTLIILQIAEPIAKPWEKPLHISNSCLQPNLPERKDFPHQESIVDNNHLIGLKNKLDKEKS